MTFNIKQVQLKDLLLEPTRNGLTKPKAIRGRGVPMIAMGEIFANNRIFSFPMERVPVTDKELSSSSIYEGDLLFARQSLVLEGAGKCCIVKEVNEPTVFESHLIRVRLDNSKALPDYIYYYFNSYQGKENIKTIVEQVAAAGIRGSDLVNLYIPIPPITVQQQILQVLMNIDDKIAINTAINENLESQAQAIFKSWFVDFEPFGGVKPEEWTEKSVYDLAEYINGAAFKKNEYSTEGIPIIKIAELKNGITDSTQYCCIEKDEKYYFDNKAILFSWSGNPETSIDTFLWYRGKAILNQHTFRVVSKYNAPAFTYFLLKYLKPKFTHIASNKQTTGLGHVTVSDLKRLQFSCSTDAIEEFEKMSKPLFDMIYNTYVESNRLSKLRDVLLPKLMNGEIDVSEVKI